jgi:hypothetical protein
VQNAEEEAYFLTRKNIGHLRNEALVYARETMDAQFKATVAGMKAVLAASRG